MAVAVSMLPYSTASARRKKREESGEWANYQSPLSVLFAILLLWLAGCGGTAVPTPTPPALSPQAQQGKAIFVTHCGSCHSTGEDTIIVGPSLAGVAARAATRVPEQDARTYLYTSIMAPDRYLVAGFTDLMPKNFAKELTGEELDAVVAYLLTLQ